MRMSIIGLPFAGKTTFFEILTARGQEGALSGKKAAQIGTAFVPDARLDRLTEAYEPKKKVEASFEFIDTPGLATDQSGQSFQGAGLEDVRKADTCCLIIQCFESPMAPHPAGGIDPERDLELIASEFVLSDLMQLENTVERLRKVVASGKKMEDQRRLETVEKAMAALEEETPLRDIDFTESELTALSGYQLLSLKPLLVVLNLGEDDVADLDARIAAFREAHPGLNVTALCAKLEQELAQMEPHDRAEFMADLGLRESAFRRITQACNDLLGLQVMFTVGPDECRAWPIPREATAYDAAGAIHTDFQRGFIRAVVLGYDEWAADPRPETFKEKARQEKKDYVMQDGDIVEFRFNVSK